MNAILDYHDIIFTIDIMIDTILPHT